MVNVPNDEASLRSLISGLEHQLTSLETWLDFWTVLVILGCGGELFFVVHEYLGERRTWSKSKKWGLKLPEKPSATMLILKFISVAFVVIGISGELKIDRESGDLQTQLRDANDNLFLLLEKESGDAKGSADQTAVAARTAQKAASSASVTASSADAASLAALNKASSAREEIERAEQDIGLAKAELSQQGPRYALFVGNARDDFELTVKPFVGQKLVIATRSTAGLEERQLGFLLLTFLYSSSRQRWDVTQDNTAPYLSPEVSLGISKGTATGSTSKAAKALAMALGAVGLTGTNGESPPRIEDYPELPPDTIKLMIGEHIAFNRRALYENNK